MEGSGPRNTPTSEFAGELQTADIIFRAAIRRITQMEETAKTVEVTVEAPYGRLPHNLPRQWR